MARGGGAAEAVEQVPDKTSVALSAARDEAAELTGRILELREAYYQRDTVLESDEVYDRMIHRLEELERLFPELQSQDSPTQTVGGRAETTLFNPVVHAERMLSLDNVFSREEFLAWAARVDRASGPAGALPLRAQDRRPRDEPPLRERRAGQRGDPRRRGRRRGRHRERQVHRQHPHQLDTDHPPPLVEIRGEVFFPVEAFDKLNAAQAEAGDRIFANPRNAASGSLRQKEEGKSAPQVERMHNRIRHLKMLVHGIGAWANPPVASQSEIYELLKSWGLPTSTHYRVVDTP